MSEQKSPGLDHFVIVVPDLDDARTTFEKLGFHVTERGYHVGWGTANHIMPLNDQYLELWGIAGEGPDTELVRRLSRNPGLWQLGFKTKDARTLTRNLLRAGVPMEEPYDYARPIQLGGEEHQVRFVVSYIHDSLHLPLRCFFCEQQTPALIWRSEWQQHENTAVGVEQVEISAERPQAVLEKLQRFCQGKLASNALRTSNTSIHVEGSTRNPEPPGRRLRIRVRQLEAAERALRKNQIPYKRDFDMIEVDPTFTYGVRLQFSESSS